MITATHDIKHINDKIEKRKKQTKKGAGATIVIFLRARYSFHSKTTPLTSSTSFTVAWYKVDGVPGHCSVLAWPQPCGSWPNFGGDNISMLLRRHIITITNVTNHWPSYAALVPLTAHRKPLCATKLESDPWCFSSTAGMQAAHYGGIPSMDCLWSVPVTSHLLWCGLQRSTFLSAEFGCFKECGNSV